MICKNCGEEMPNPPVPRPKVTIFSLDGLWENLFTEPGIAIMLIIMATVVAVFGSWGNKDSEYDAIKKALATPGVSVHLTKDEKGEVGWKILKEAQPAAAPQTTER